MSGSRKRGETIRKFILDSVFRHPRDIVAVTAKEFGISPQAVNKHVKQLLAREALDVTGATRNRRYALRTTLAKTIKYRLSNLKEDVVWTKDIAPLVSNLPKNVRDIWQYGLTEMLNNAIDHSSGTIVHVSVYKTATGHEMFVIDDGEGIFAKIQRALHLDDERHAVLELSKGKLTTEHVSATAGDEAFSRLFVGRVVPSKGQVELVDAFAAFKSAFATPCRLVFVGRDDVDIGYVRDVRRRAKQHGISDQVTLTGAVSDRELHDWYRRADLYVSLSHHEGFGVPLGGSDGPRCAGLGLAGWRSTLYARRRG